MTTVKERATAATDPVCGMKVDPQTAAGSSKFGETTYSFCSRGCKTKFDGAPQRYVSGAASPTAGCCGTSSGHSCC